MDNMSFFAGALLGFGISCLGFGIIFYRYMKNNTDENLKNYRELREIVNKLEVAPDGNNTEKREE